MNVQRLETLANWLENNSEEIKNSFDMYDWKCGTTCCAIGFAATSIPEFQKEGFMLKMQPVSKTGSPIYKSAGSWKAVDKFFDLAPLISESLFCKSNYFSKDRKNPEAVVAKIRNLIKIKE